MINFYPSFIVNVINMALFFLFINITHTTVPMAPTKPTVNHSRRKSSHALEGERRRPSYADASSEDSVWQFKYDESGNLVILRFPFNSPLNSPTNSPRRNPIDRVKQDERTDG